MDFKERYGPWAVITGASEGTGRAFAHRIAKQGVSCVLVARREEPLAVTAAEIRAKGVECVTATVDLGTLGAAARLIEAVGDREVGLFIANAGADTLGSAFLDQDVDVWEQLMHCNVTTTLRCCHHFGQAMRDRRRGGLLLVNSGACYGGMPALAVYCGVKAFALAFGESLWAELRPHGVDVLNFVLGRTDTPAFRRALEEKGIPMPPNLAAPDAVAEVGLARLAHGPVHNWGQNDDVAGLAPASPDARRERIVAMEALSRQVLKAAQS